MGVLMRSRIFEMCCPTAHEPGSITQCRRFPIGSELSHDIDCGGGKMVGQQSNNWRRLAPLAGLIDFFMFDGGATKYVGEPRLHGVVDVAFAALAINIHAFLQQRIRPTEQHLMKRPMVLEPTAQT